MRRSRSLSLSLFVVTKFLLTAYSYIVPGLGDFGDRFYTM